MSSGWKIALCFNDDSLHRHTAQRPRALLLPICGAVFFLLGLVFGEITRVSPQQQASAT